MKWQVKKVAMALGLTAAIAAGFVAPAYASYSGTYNCSMTNGSMKQLANGDHSSSYNMATASINSGCAANATFWVYMPSVGRCSSTVTLSPRRTGTMTYNTSFSGSVSLYGQLSGYSGTTDLSGSYCFNVR